MATFLLVWFSFSLIAPAVFANRQSDLPACCRRDGKHHCAMGRSQGRRGTDGKKSSDATVQSVVEKCSSYPAGLAVAELGKTFVPHGTAIVFPMPGVGSLAIGRASLARFTDQDGSCFQRGPPAFLS